MRNHPHTALVEAIMIARSSLYMRMGLKAVTRLLLGKGGGICRRMARPSMRRGMGSTITHCENCESCGQLMEVLTTRQFSRCWWEYSQQGSWEGLGNSSCCMS